MLSKGNILNITKTIDLYVIVQLNNAKNAEPHLII
jgi:hypothetical protein